MTDFEIAAIDAINEVFPNATTKGCTFHFCQALMRRLADIGLRTEYSSGSPCIKDWVRQIMGLTLLPVVFIPTAWNILKFSPLVDDQNTMVKMQSFSDYFERTWIHGSFELNL